MSRSDIDALNATFMKGMETGDAAMIASVYAPDALVMPPGAPVVTGAGIEQFWRGVLGMGVTGAVLKTVTLEERDDVAVEEGSTRCVRAPTSSTPASTSSSIAGSPTARGAWASTAGTPTWRPRPGSTPPGRVARQGDELDSPHDRRDDGDRGWLALP